MDGVSIWVVLAWVVGVPVAILLSTLFLLMGAILQNIESLGFGRALLISLAEAVLLTALGIGGYFLLRSVGHPLELSQPVFGLRNEKGQMDVLMALILLGIFGAGVVVTVLLYWLVIPTGLGKAIKVWLVRAGTNALAVGFVAALVVVGLAVYQLTQQS